MLVFTVVNPARYEKQIEEEVVALSYHGVGIDCYVYHGLQEGRTDWSLVKLKQHPARSINKEATTFIF